MTERLRKFFRIRGKTGFVLDEVVAPVVLVQDLTVGPYQAGVVPCASESRLSGNNLPWSIVVLLNDKAGSLTPVLDRQFDNRSFSLTWSDIQNIDILAVDADNFRLQLSTRADVVAMGVPTQANSFFSIQNNDGKVSVPVEIFQFDATPATGSIIWRGVLGDNTNALGSRRTWDDIQPNITIGPNDALVFTSPFNPGTGTIQTNYRGFYKEQPA